MVAQSTLLCLIRGSYRGMMGWPGGQLQLSPLTLFMTLSKKTTRILYAIIAKAIIEIVLFAGIASYSAWANFHPSVRGALDLVGGVQISGWAADPGSGEHPVEVQLFIDGRFCASQTAASPRPDLVTAGATTTSGHGFSFDLRSVPLSRGHHIAEVFVLRNGLNGNLVLIPLSNDKRSFFYDR